MDKLTTLQNFDPVRTSSSRSPDPAMAIGQVWSRSKTSLPPRFEDLKFITISKYSINSLTVEQCGQTRRISQRLRAH